MDTALLVALEGGVIKKCRMTDLFVFFEVFYLSASSAEMPVITRVVLSFLSEFWVWRRDLRCSD